ncbi:MAG TPA: SpoIIE family protein phosphatase [Vicinamibacterales bacterium]|nr:SpoIIE family protein phosphatase [Vicinamibacterales bacterium]
MMRSFLGTVAGRVILVGIAIRLLDFLLGRFVDLPSAFRVVDAFAVLAIAAGALYFLVRGMEKLNRRLLWRVRSKLFISYIFIGVVPAILVVAFFLLGGVLLFFNFSAYMVRSEFRAITERARTIAHTVALEVERSSDPAATIARLEPTFSAEFPGISIALVPSGAVCSDGVRRDAHAVRVGSSSASIATAGAWAHVAPPTSIPAWIKCSGFSGLLLYAAGDPRVPGAANLVVRAVAFPESSTGFAAVVDLDVNAGVRRELRKAIGIQLGNVDVQQSQLAAAKTLEARGPSPTWTIGPGGDDAVPPLSSFTFLEYHDWLTGTSQRFTVFIRLGIPEIYGRISAAPGADGTVNIVMVILELVAGLFLVVEVVALATGLTLAKSITGSVHELFVGTERVRRGDFTHKIAVKADDQLGELAISFNSMTASIEDLLRQAAEKRRLEEELRIAHEIQMSLLPQGPLRMPGLSVSALCVPAREVGGDYYDFFPLDDHRLGVLIADVSGKGTSAALYMAELKGLMLSLSRIHSSPRELLVHADRAIAPHLDSRSFITVTYAVIDLQSMTMTYARAGHTPLIYLAGDRGGPATVLTPSGMVLGLKLDRGQIFERLLEEAHIPLRTGDLFALFTDGITEATTVDDDFFGDERLARVLEAHRDLPLEQLRERVFRDIESFVGAAQQHDDMTLILLRVEEAAQA